jgi:hypothetical protein
MQNKMKLSWHSFCISLQNFSVFGRIKVYSQFCEYLSLKTLNFIENVHVSNL